MHGWHSLSPRKYEGKQGKNEVFGRERGGWRRKCNKYRTLSRTSVGLWRVLRSRCGRANDDHVACDHPFLSPQAPSWLSLHGLAQPKTYLIPLIPVYSAKTVCKTSPCAGTLDLEGSIHDRSMALR